MIFDTSGLESQIGYSFKDKMLLRKCFTHSSYAHEQGVESNELLEFFGDAILDFVVTEYLVKNFSGDEGKLTTRRAEIVSNEALLKVVKELRLGEFILLGKGLHKTDMYEGKLYSSVYEALVAGIYLDGGIASAKKFINNTVCKRYASIQKLKTKITDNVGWKNQLQEYVQKGRMGSISYQTLSKTGPDHLPEFRVAVLLNGSRLAEGKGTSKKFAEADSAKKALTKLKQEGKKR